MISTLFYYIIWNMNNLRIFVCSHKLVEEIPHDEVYTPLHLERVHSSDQEAMAHYVGDDTGDNISDKGAHYSEGTAIYWIWKNCHDCKYVGLTQYRRQFEQRFTNENIESFFQDGTEVILPKKYFRPRTRLFTVLTYMQMEDFLILRAVLKKVAPDYLPTFHRFLRDYIDYPFNMVICRKSLYDRYASWVFSICNEMEKYVQYSSYPNSSRLFGYIIELLTPVYFLHHRCKIKEMEVLFQGKRFKMHWLNRLRMMYRHAIIAPLSRYEPIWLDPSFFRGLKQAGVNLEFDPVIP